MSFYLQAATETADLIDHGEVQEGSKSSHSDFERLLGITEIKKKQLRALEEKRIQSLEELEEGRRRRAHLRDQMQHARNEAIIEEKRHKKDEERKKKQEQTLRDRLNAALAEQGVVIAGNNENGDNNNNNSVIKLSNDPFLRFRAEDNRVQMDKQRLNETKMVHGKNGSDILRRFVEGASDWSTRRNQQLKEQQHDDTNTSDDASEHKQQQQQQQQASTNFPLTASIQPELRVPTVANLISGGYGKVKSTSLAHDAVKSNQRVEQSFRQLDEKDRHDFREWEHRRNFYNKERIGVLEQMKAEGFFRHSFSDDAAPKGSKRDTRTGNLLVSSGVGVGLINGDDHDDSATSTILGHNVKADHPARRKHHPIDDYRDAVRDSVQELHSAQETWKVITGNQVEEISNLQRATNVSSLSSSAATTSRSPIPKTNAGLFRSK